MKDGRRAGPISGYFEAVDPGDVPVSGLEILRYSKATRIDFDATGTALAVAVQCSAAAWISRNPAWPAPPRLARDGLLVLAAGALATPRLLLLSGIGPRGREAEMFPGQSPAHLRSTMGWWASGCSTTSSPWSPTATTGRCRTPRTITATTTRTQPTCSTTWSPAAGRMRSTNRCRFSITATGPIPRTSRSSSIRTVPARRVDRTTGRGRCRLTSCCSIQKRAA